MTNRVAVIGAGPGGLVAARWLLSQGFEPTIFDQAPMLGGQWTGLPGISGVWPTMHTNTSRVLTKFSDLEHATDVVFPTGRDILDYLHRYADAFGLIPRLRLGARVDLVSRCGTGWQLSQSGKPEQFDRVVVATGRFNSPAIPPVSGLDTFTGSVGVASTYQYRNPEPYMGKRVLVAGGAISALEIAAELAHPGARPVVVTQRRQRYVLPKFAAGVPSDHRVFTRYNAIADGCLPMDVIGRQLKEVVVEAGGNPAQYGAPAPDPSFFGAGVTLSQQYLPLVAEGRISVKPWMSGIDGSAVTFADGTVEEFDGILFGTGFKLHLPFLDRDIRSVLNLDGGELAVDRYTFHPDLPGLAFVGMWDQSGGYFVPLELQARWIAYTWAGRVPAPDAARQRESIQATRAPGARPQKTRMNLAAIAFARAAGIEPRLENWPDLRRALLFGPLAPSCFRLEGPDALPDAPTRFADDAAAFGAITSNELTEPEQRYCALLHGF